MGFNDLMTIEPVSMSTTDRLEEVDQVARDRIAQRLQMRLRSQIDPGIDLEAAVRSQAVRVDPDVDSFVVSHEDQADVMNPNAQEQPQRADPNEVTDIEQLFDMSSGIPTAVNGKLVYRTISPALLFGAQRQAEKEQIATQVIESTLRDEIVDAYDESFSEVRRRHPVNSE